MRSRIHRASDTNPYHLCNMGSLRLLASVFLILQSQVLACEFDSDCSDGQKCCNYECYDTTDCQGFACTSDEQCGDPSNLACCEGSCAWGSNCLGHSCSSSVDCSFGENCCYGVCQEYDDCDDGTDHVTLVVIIVGSVVGVGIVCCVCVIVCTCRRRTRNRGQVLANQRITQTATTYGSTSYGNQAMPPQPQHYCGGVPSGNYPPYPPPQVGQPNMGYQNQYPVPSAAPAQQSGAPPAYADVVGSERVQQHVGAAEVPHSPEPSAPSF